MSISLHPVTLSLLLAAAMAVPSMEGKAETVYSTDFESFAVGQTFTDKDVAGWTGNHDAPGTIVQISGAAHHSGKQALHQVDMDDKNMPVATYNLGKTLSSGEVSVAVLSSSTVRIEGLDNAGQKNFSIVHEYYATAGASVWQVREGDKVVKFVPDTESGFDPKGWNVVSFVFDEGKKSFSLKINGRTAMTVAAGEADSIHWSLAQLAIKTGWWSGAGEQLDAYYDDLSISTPTP